MDEFLTANGFPLRTMTLRHFRFKDSSLKNLFKPGTATKPSQIKPILNSYPHRRFILVGDSGQHDPEVYASLMKEFSDQIGQVFIRNVTNGSRQDERFREVFAGIEPDKWMLFDVPNDLPQNLK